MTLRTVARDTDSVRTISLIGAVLLKIGASYLADLVHANHPRQPFPAASGPKGRTLTQHVRGGRNWTRKSPSGGQYCKRFCTNELYLFRQWCLTSSERGAAVSYRYSFEDLLALLHGHAPAKVDAVALHRRRVEHGHLSVGLKIHCLGDGSQFSTLVEGLGGAQKILDVNYYKHSHASLCLVLPPVGSARSAILLLECIEHFIGSALFSNPEIQIQVCSPGRLGARRSALLAIGFYLGSDTLRRYALGDLATSFAEHQNYPRGRRLVLYDAKGDFDRNFDWWKESGKHRLVEPQLPFENGRSDLLTGSGSRLDIQNINLLATLLVHAQYQGYWNQLGMQFQEEMEALLERHVLSGLVDAPWVRTDDPESDDDDGFFAALQELVAYAFEESVRIKKKGRLFSGWHADTSQVISRNFAGSAVFASEVPQ